jgi:hypothetical protein
MINLGKYASLLSDLSLDASHFPHGTPEQFIDSLIADYRIRQASIRPLLLSRAMIVGSRANDSFRIALSGNLASESANSFNAHARSIELLATTDSLHEALDIAADLRKYYLRHFPGRCHRNTGESNFDSFKPVAAHVYIAFFDKVQFPPRDSA